LLRQHFQHIRVPISRADTNGNLVGSMTGPSASEAHDVSRCFGGQRRSLVNMELHVTPRVVDSLAGNGVIAFDYSQAPIHSRVNEAQEIVLTNCGVDRNLPVSRGWTGRPESSNRPGYLDVVITLERT